jgi:hypothetical protein
VSRDLDQEKLSKILDDHIAAALAASNKNRKAQTSPNIAADSGAPEQIGGRQCHVHGFRHELTGQFYALSHEDRVAMDKHCEGILADLKPENHREAWLATAIAEDQWRLNRARALENNIFAIGMSGPLAAATDADSPEVLAAVCQARVWLADGKNLQMLSIYEQRIRRGIEKNETQLQELQAERKAERAQALEEAILLAELALSEGENYDPTDDLHENGFGFSAPEIFRLASRRVRLRKARQLQQQPPCRGKRTEPILMPNTKAA